MAAVKSILLACVCGAVVLGSTIGSPQVGQNFSVPCDLPVAVTEITWFHLHGERLSPLLTLSLGKMNQSISETYSRTVDLKGDVLQPPVSLHVIAVNETDAGRYYCVGRDRLRYVTSRALRLSFGGKTSRLSYPGV
ncbi:unnamed protein product [Lota lota]